MQIDIEIRQDAGYCLVRFIGPFDIGAFGDGLRNLVARPDYPKGLPTVFDLSAADLSTMGQREIYSIRALNQEHAGARGEVRIGVFAPDDVAFGVARMYQAIAVTPNLQAEIFRTFDDAVAYATRA